MFINRIHLFTPDSMYVQTICKDNLETNNPYFHLITSICAYIIYSHNNYY